MSDLKVYHNNNDTVIASNYDEVAQVLCETYGYASLQDFYASGDWDEFEWSPYEDDDYIKIGDTSGDWLRAIREDEMCMRIFEPPEDCVILCRAKAKEWVKTAHGKPMFLCSTEY